MKEPTFESWKYSAQRCDDIWNFPNCCGALYSKHIRIQHPAHAGSLFYNYKHYHSIVLQAVVDADAEFIAVVIGDYGKNGDGGVFSVSNFGEKFYGKHWTCRDLEK